jgi:hypothetical protein
MINRLTARLGIAIVLTGITAAWFVGAASAAADTGVQSDSDSAKSSESTSETAAKTGPAANTSSGNTTSLGAEANPVGTSPNQRSTPARQASTATASPSPSRRQGIPLTFDAVPLRPSQSPREQTSGLSVNTPSGQFASTTTKTRTGEQNSRANNIEAARLSVAPGQLPTSPRQTFSAAVSLPSTPAESAVAETGELAPTAVAKASEAIAVVSATSMVAVDDQASTSRPLTLIDFVGSIVLNVVMGLIQTFDGAPVLPAGSNVTVRTSTLTIPVAGGQTVEADWYFPDDGDTPTHLIYFQHGFMASGPMYSYTAATLAEQTDSIVVVPSLTSNFFDPDAAWLGGTPMQQAVADLFVGSRTALTESASAAAGYEVTLPTRFVLAGHSMGGSLVMGAAGDMVDNGAIADLAGVLLLDSVDVNDSVPTALQKLTGVNYRPVYDISSERYVWNMYGKVGDELEAARPGQFNGVMLVGGRHIDALQGGNPLLQLSEYLAAGFSQPQNIEAVKILAVGWVNDMFAGTHDGIYGAPQQSIQIDTSAGTATAVVLPFTSTQRVQATPFDGVLSVVLDFLQNFFVYEPLATAP